MIRMRKFLLAALAIIVLASGQSVVPLGSVPPATGAVTVGSDNCVQTVSNSTGVVITNPTVGGRGTCQVHFTNPGSVDWTVPSGVSSFSVLVVGAGGGGGGDAGGGGGGGAVFDGTVTFSASSAATTMAVTVGAGGLPGVHTVLDPAVAPFDVTRTTPTAGGGSSLSVTDTSSQALSIAAGGGAGGQYGSTAYQAAGGAGGTVTVTDNSSLLASSGSSLTGASGGNGVDFDLRASGLNGSSGHTLSSFPSNGTIGGAYGGGGGGGASIGADTDVGGIGGTGGGGAGSGGLVEATAATTLSFSIYVFPREGSYARVFAAAGAAKTGGGGGAGAAQQLTDQYSINGESNRSRNGRSGGTGLVVIRYELPLAVTAATTVTSITTTTAAVASSVTSSSSVTARGFVVASTTDPVIGGAGVTSVSAGSGTGSFTADLTGLTLGSTYYVRAYSTNGGGTSYGATQVFTTAANAIATTAGSVRWFAGATVVDAGITVSGSDLTGATVSIDNNKTGDVLACGTAVAGISCSYNSSSGVLTLSGSATSAAYQSALRGVTFAATNVSTNTDQRTITFNIGGTLTFDPATGHYYEIVTVSSGGSTYGGGNAGGTKGDLVSGSQISWEESRCRAKYSNAKFGGTVEAGTWSGATRVAGGTTQLVDGCVTISGSGSLEARTLNGLPGHLANITSLSEHQFLRTKLTGTGWIGGSDIDVEGRWIWMDGPEAGQAFWVHGTTPARRTSTSVEGADRFNYWSEGEPNNASGEHWAEFGFGSAGVGSSWNDCRNGCGRSTYIVEYSASGGAAPPSLSATRTISPLPAQSITFSPAASLVYGAGTLTLSATSSAGATVSLAITSGDGTVCSLSGLVLTWIAPGSCVVSATQAGNDTDGGFQPAAQVNRTIAMAKRNLAVTGLSAVSREYDRNTAVTITGTPVPNGSDILADDVGNVTIGGTATGSISTSAAGENKPVTVGGLTLSGSRAFAYQIVVSGLTVTIDQRPVRMSGSFTVADRPYNRSRTVTPSAQSLSLRAGDVLAGDTVGLGTVTFSADTADAGSRVASPSAVLNGTQAANYRLSTDDLPTATFSITPVSLSVASGTFTPMSRVSDGSTSATISSHDLVLQGFVAGDSSADLTWTPSGVFDSSAAGTDKTVTLQGGAVFGGAKGGNYVLDVTGAPTALASITPAPVAQTAAAPVTPPAIVTPPRILPRVLPTPPPVVGPVVQNGGGSLPPSQPTALMGGRPLPIQTQVTDPNTMSLRAGVLNIGMNVPSNQGGGVSSQGGTTELQVRNGGAAALNGSGLLPRSTVQVFMPLQGSNAREIARIPVDANGSFSGDAVFGSTPTEAPLPIGRHVLQVVTVDENRQQTVVEMTINIAQPPPTPEVNRSTNERPALLPGQSIATNGGVPEPVTVTPIPDQRQATIQGDGWSMVVQADGAGGVAPGEGGAVVTFVRDQGAVVSGEGFMPNTRADVWLFSDPTLLGTVDIDENGEFNGTVNIDGNVVAVGEHTLQLQGVGEDGFVRAANLGVTVTDEAPTLTEQTSGSVLWLLLVALGVIVVGAGGAWWYRRATR